MAFPQSLQGLCESLFAGLARVFDALLPSPCIACRVAPRTGGLGPFCVACAALMRPSQRGPWPWAFAPFSYEGPLREAIGALKFKGRSDLAAPLGEFLVERAESLSEPITLVPIPLSRARLIERGYNQTSLLSRHVARRIGARSIDALARTRFSIAQAKLDRSARLTNIEGAFACRRPVTGHVVLIDDVITTGATLAEARRTLLNGGASNVSALAVAQTPSEGCDEAAEQKKDPLSF